MKKTSMSLIDGKKSMLNKRLDEADKSEWKKKYESQKEI
jgi:hypothetical protein